MHDSQVDLKQVISAELDHCKLFIQMGGGGDWYLVFKGYSFNSIMGHMQWSQYLQGTGWLTRTRVQVV